MNEESARNGYSLIDIAGSVSRLMNIAPPAGARTEIAPLVNISGGRTVEKLLIYDPDAVAMWLWRKHPDFFVPVAKHTCLTLPVESVMKSVTPVCFASIYTGYKPCEHGIQKYEKPVLKCDTLFDALLRAGKKVAIVAVAECSIARIFLERDLDYYITASDRESIETAIRLLGEDKYDAITLYNGSYDSTMHRSGVESEAALSVLQQNAVDFDRVVTAAKKVWAGRNALFGWVTDHGAHDDEVSGRGSHGQDIAEDMNVVHFWGTNLPACTPEQ